MPKPSSTALPTCLPQLGVIPRADESLALANALANEQEHPCKSEVS